MTASNPYFLLQNPSLKIKWRCLQKKIELNNIKINYTLAVLNKKKYDY